MWQVLPHGQARGGKETEARAPSPALRGIKLGFLKEVRSKQKMSKSYSDEMEGEEGPGSGSQVSAARS